MQKRIIRIAICIFLIIITFNFGSLSLAQEDTTNTDITTMSSLEETSMAEEPKSYPADIFGLFFAFFLGLFILKVYRNSIKGK